MYGWPKAIPNRPIKPVHIRVLPRSARQRNGEASFAVSPEINTTGCLRWHLLHIHISKLGKREVIYTLKSPAEWNEIGARTTTHQCQDADLLLCTSSCRIARWRCGYHGFSMNEEGKRGGYGWATSIKKPKIIWEDGQAAFVMYACFICDKAMHKILKEKLKICRTLFWVSEVSEPNKNDALKLPTINDTSQSFHFQMHPVYVAHGGVSVFWSKIHPTKMQNAKIYAGDEPE